MCTLLILLTIITTYTEKTFHTECAVPVEASIEVANEIVDQMIAEFNTDPELLFKWAFYGAGKQNDAEKEVFLLNFKHTEYIPEEGYGRAVLDVIVPHLTIIEDVTLEARVKDEYGTAEIDSLITADNCRSEMITKWSRRFFIDADYSGNLLKDAYGNLYIIPVGENKCVYYMDMHVRFGWFFKIFISKKTYKNTVEWRIAQYMDNLKKEAERIQQHGYK